MITGSAGLFTIRRRYRVLASSSDGRAPYDIGSDLLLKSTVDKIPYPTRRFDERRSADWAFYFTRPRPPPRRCGDGIGLEEFFGTLVPLGGPRLDASPLAPRGFPKAVSSQNGRFVSAAAVTSTERRDFSCIPNGPRAEQYSKTKKQGGAE